MKKICQIDYQNKENAAITDDNVFKLNKPDQSDPLQAVLREGARKMLVAAIEGGSVSIFIERHGSLETTEGKKRRWEGVLDFV